MNLKAMFFKRAFVAAIAATSLAVVALAFYSPTSELVQNLAFIEEEPEPTNSISGLPGGDGPVLVVKIDDTRPAHPQIGLEEADIVYIEQVEGGLTRLAAVFSSTIPERIGPVRSARISDIELVAQYGYVGFAFSGVQKKMRPVINAAPFADLGAETHSPLIYTTDPNRIQPYAMVLRADRLMQFIQEKAITLVTSKNMGWNFGAAPDGGVAITSVHLAWPASSYDAHWSQEEDRWLLDHSGQPDIADSGIQLGPKTVVIQMVSITNSIYKDKVGGVTPLSKTVGTGRGYILRDGSYFKALWSRPSDASGTTWTMPTGQAIDFPEGQIWVALTDKEPIFKVVLPDAPKSTTK
ncbi:MAG: DUF3048 domain-containing protein [Candidatus Planktophila sp.]|jgi:hypothetical protein|tara:strand:+ start:8146 stop:9201 length:1056 start_codon:yes stop_codon:yes gene_type:complete